jgi:hypothetical protein
MDRLFSSLSQWVMYFLPTIVAVIRKRMGKPLPLSLGMFFFANLALAWTVVVWILLMINAFGLNPVPWLAVRLAKVLPTGGPGPMAVPQEANASGNACGNCSGTRSVTCPQCHGRGSWYSQPTTATGVAELEGCNYCSRSGRIRCPYC